ncbi:MAG: hypothetical protein Q8P98_09295, partial [Candidatus Rokubacteria bacterium]|nr:hypothetical protein [Candidatus Rokubacteria bacterium]
MKKKKTVLFDIDYTLFDVNYFNKNFHKKMAGLFGLDEIFVRESSIDAIDEIVSSNSFLDIDKYIILFLKKIKKEEEKKEVEKLFYNSRFFKKGFYKEVKKTLKLVSKIAKIGIFSKGDYKFQWAKIEQSGFKDFFHKETIYIGHDKLKFIPVLKKNHKDEKIFLVDDKPMVIYEIKKNFPSVFTIWLKRGKYTDEAKEIPDYNPDATIDNLLEVVE